jgi:hypothetical protein
VRPCEGPPIWHQLSSLTSKAQCNLVITNALGLTFIRLVEGTRCHAFRRYYSSTVLLFSMPTSRNCSLIFAWLSMIFNEDDPSILPCTKSASIRGSAFYHVVVHLSGINHDVYLNNQPQESAQEEVPTRSSEYWVPT